MPLVEPVIETLLTAGLLLLALASFNLLGLVLGRLLQPPRDLSRAPLDPTSTPSVLVQIPLFNEGELVEDVLEAVSRLDWPRDRLQIQVLDDSNDGRSLALSECAVARLRQEGHHIELLHRTRRTAFKAGALAEGLARSQATYVAIFDADFVPPEDFLRQTVGVLSANPRFAYVQARWAHSNRDGNMLTRAQARLLDAHFEVEQEARWRLGLPVPFNGTCGVWRRHAIDDAGGWQGDTLTEDLDLSLRARLRGWESAYLRELPVPGLLPVSPRAWRTQQFRWTKGFVQCFVKLTPGIWTSPALSLWQKLLISLQIGQPLVFLMGTLCILLGLPFIAGAAVAGDALATAAVLATLLGFAGPLGFLTLAGTSTGMRATTTEILGALFLTTGLLLSNGRAGLEALLGHRSEFVRTPKAATSPRARGRVPATGLLELSAGVGLLGFTLIEAPVSAVYMLTVIGGLVGVGTLQMLDGTTRGPGHSTDPAGP